jgi:hypothetical protein
MNLLNSLLCLAGFHAWYEYKIDFFDPTNIFEYCPSCRARRERVDKTRRKEVF